MPSSATSRLQGLTTSVAVKPPCVTVATSNITLAGLQTVSGVTVDENDRVLVKGQSDGTENGIYNASTGDWTRAKDFDGALDAVSGTRILIRNSGIDGVEYELTSPDPIVIGNSSLTFALRYGANATYDQTEAEIFAEVVPTNDRHLEGDVRRYGAVCDDIADDSLAIVAAMSVADAATNVSGRGYVVIPPGRKCFIGATTVAIPNNVIFDLQGAAIRCSGVTALTFGLGSRLLGHSGFVTTSGGAGAALKKTVQTTPEAFYIEGWPVIQADTPRQASSVGVDFTGNYKGVLEVSVSNFEINILGGAGTGDEPQTYYTELRSPRSSGGNTAITLLQGCNGTLISNPQVNASNIGRFGIRTDGVSGLVIVGGYVEGFADHVSSRGLLVHNSANVTVLGGTYEIGASATSNFAIGATGTTDGLNLYGVAAAGGWGDSSKVMEHTASGLYNYIGGGPSNQIIRLGQSGWASEANGTIRVNKVFGSNISGVVSAAAATAHTLENTADGLGLEIANNSSTTTAGRAALVLNRKGGAGCAIALQTNGATAPGIYYGAGSPEGVQVAPTGSVYLNASGGAGTALYAKESGAGNTGWVAR